MAKNVSTPDRPKPSLPVSSMFLYGCGAGILGVAMLDMHRTVQRVTPNKTSQDDFHGED
jgi:hypothetical protein